MPIAEGRTDVAELLGVPDGTRAVVPHIDDIGMCHGANEAYARLAGRGFITSGSVMVPCPWFREAVDICTADPALDIGVHLTLTSEWRRYRWRPLSTVAPSSGLLDADGYMWRTVAELRANAHPEAAAVEMRMQLERALAAGLDVTHLDAHMAAALSPELAEGYLRLGVEFGLPVLFPRDPRLFFSAFRPGELDWSRYDELLALLDRNGMPALDHFAMTPGVPASEVEAAYKGLVSSVPAGFSMLAFHCNAPGDIESIVPDRARWRTDEYALFSTPDFCGWIASQGLRLTGFREIRDRLRARRAGKAKEGARDDRPGYG